jgi:hypothetical protein
MLSFVRTKHYGWDPDTGTVTDVQKPNCTTCHDPHLGDPPEPKLRLANYTEWENKIELGPITNIDARVAICSGFYEGKNFSRCHTSPGTYPTLGQPIASPTSDGLIPFLTAMFLPVVAVVLIVFKRRSKGVTPFITTVLLMVVSIVVVSILYSWTVMWRAPTEIVLDDVMFEAGDPRVCESECHAELYTPATFNESHRCSFCHLKHIGGGLTTETYITTYTPYGIFDDYSLFYNVSNRELTSYGPPGFKPKPHGEGDCIGCHINIHDDTPQPNAETECYNCHKHMLDRVVEGRYRLMSHEITQRSMNLSLHVTEANKDCMKSGCHNVVHGGYGVMVVVKNTGSFTTYVMSVTVDDRVYKFEVIVGDLEDGLQPEEVVMLRLKGFSWRRGETYRVKVVCTTAEAEGDFRAPL